MVAFFEAIALPWGVRGPVESCAFLRFAWICSCVDMICSPYSLASCSCGGATIARALYLGRNLRVWCEKRDISVAWFCLSHWAVRGYEFILFLGLAG